MLWVSQCFFRGPLENFLVSVVGLPHEAVVDYLEDLPSVFFDAVDFPSVKKLHGCGCIMFVVELHSFEEGLMQSVR
jgi:hypothetical protein